MPLPATIDIAKENLFASIDEMRERNIPEVIQQRLIRLRDMYNYWLQYPRIREQEIVLELQKRYNIQKSAAYEDIRIIKYLLGDLFQSTHPHGVRQYIFQSADFLTYTLIFLRTFHGIKLKSNRLTKKRCNWFIISECDWYTIYVPL